MKHIGGSFRFLECLPSNLLNEFFMENINNLNFLNFLSWHRVENHTGDTFWQMRLINEIINLMMQLLGTVFGFYSITVADNKTSSNHSETHHKTDHKLAVFKYSLLLTWWCVFASYPYKNFPSISGLI